MKLLIICVQILIFVLRYKIVFNYDSLFLELILLLPLIDQQSIKGLEIIQMLLGY